MQWVYPNAVSMKANKELAKSSKPYVYVGIGTYEVNDTPICGFTPAAPKLDSKAIELVEKASFYLSSDLRARLVYNGLIKPVVDRVKSLFRKGTMELKIWEKNNNPFSGDSLMLAFLLASIERLEIRTLRKRFASSESEIWATGAIGLDRFTSKPTLDKVSQPQFNEKMDAFLDQKSSYLFIVPKENCDDLPDSIKDKIKKKECKIIYINFFDALKLSIFNSKKKSILAVEYYQLSVLVNTLFKWKSFFFENFKNLCWLMLILIISSTIESRLHSPIFDDLGHSVYSTYGVCAKQNLLFESDDHLALKFPEDSDKEINSWGGVIVTNIYTFMARKFPILSNISFFQDAPIDDAYLKITLHGKTGIERFELKLRNAAGEGEVILGAPLFSGKAESGEVYPIPKEWQTIVVPILKFKGFDETKGIDAIILGYSNDKLYGGNRSHPTEIYIKKIWISSHKRNDFMAPVIIGFMLLTIFNLPYFFRKIAELTLTKKQFHKIGQSKVSTVLKPFH